MERYEFADGTVYLIREADQKRTNYEYEVARVFVNWENETGTITELQGTYSDCRKFLDSLRRSRRDLAKPRRICDKCGYLGKDGYEYPEYFCSAGVGDDDPLLIEDGHGNLGCCYTGHQLKVKADYLDGCYPQWG